MRHEISIDDDDLLEIEDLKAIDKVKVPFANVSPIAGNFSPSDSHLLGSYAIHKQFQDVQTKNKRPRTAKQRTLQNHNIHEIVTNGVDSEYESNTMVHEENGVPTLDLKSVYLHDPWSDLNDELCKMDAEVSSGSEPNVLQHKRAYELYEESLNPDIPISKQLMYLKRSLFLNSTSEVVYFKLIDLLSKHFMDSKEALILCHSVRQFRKDQAIGFLKPDYYSQDQTQGRSSVSNTHNCTSKAVNVKEVLDYFKLEIKFVELLDEQMLRFIMEGRIQTAQHCLQEIVQTLEAMKEDLNFSLEKAMENTINIKHEEVILPNASKKLEEPTQKIKQEPMAALSIILNKKQKNEYLKKVKELYNMVSMHEAILLVYLERYDDAIESLNKIEDKLQSVHTRILRAQIYLKYLNDLKRGRIELEYLCAHHIEIPQVKQMSEDLGDMLRKMRMKGTQLLIAKKYEEAIRIFGDTIEVLPTDIQSYFKRAQCLCQLKLFPAAVKDLFECIKLSGGSNEEAEIMLANALFEIGMDIVMTTNKQVNDNSCNQGQNSVNASIQNMQQNDKAECKSLEASKLNEAIKYFSEALKWHRNYKFYVARADCHLVLKGHEAALKDYTKAKKYSNDSNEVLQRLSSLHNEWGKILFQEKKYLMAEEELTRSLQFYRFNTTVYLNRCKVRFKLKKHPEAIQDAVASYLIDSSNLEALQLVKQYVPSVLNDANVADRMYKKIFSEELEIENRQDESASQSPFPLTPTKYIHQIPALPNTPPRNIDKKRRSSNSRPLSAPSSRRDSRHSTHSEQSQSAMRNSSFTSPPIDTIGSWKDDSNPVTSPQKQSSRSRQSISRILQYSTSLTKSLDLRATSRMSRTPRNGVSSISFQNKNQRPLTSHSTRRSQPKVVSAPSSARKSLSLERKSSNLEQKKRRQSEIVDTPETRKSRWTDFTNQLRNKHINKHVHNRASS